MPNRRVAANCSNFPDVKQGIVLHAIPFYGSENPIAKKRWRQWINIVKSKHAHWEPTSASKIFSAHFKPEDYMRTFFVKEGQADPCTPRLIRDEIGVVPVPTIHAKPKEEGAGPSSNSDCGSITSVQKRRNRRVVKDALAASEYVAPEADNLLPVDATTSDCDDIVDAELPEDEALVQEKYTQTQHCVGCVTLQKENRVMKNKLISLRAKLKIMRNKAKWCSSKKRKLSQKLSTEGDPSCVPKSISEDEEIAEDDYNEDVNDDDDDDLHDPELHEPEQFEMEVDSDTDSEVDADNQNLTSGKRDLEEPKHIIFLSQLLLLFKLFYLQS